MTQHVMIRPNAQSFFLYLKLLSTTFFLVLNYQSVNAAEISLAWNPSIGATGYKLYYGYESRNYPFVADIGQWTECTISDLDLGRMYYFAVTAYNESAESNYSWELACTFNPCDSDIDVDGDIDGSDLADIVVNTPATTLSELAAGFGKQNCFHLVSN